MKNLGELKMTFDYDDMVRICNEITKKCGAAWVEQCLHTVCEENFMQMINWSKLTCIGHGLSYGFYNNATKKNRAEWIHNKTYNIIMNFSFNTLVDLDIDKDGIYYYENLEVDINNEWKNNKDYWDGTACIVGEYTFKPFSFFKTEDQLVAFAAAKYNLLNNKYMALLNELNDKTAKTWKNLIIKKKQKKAKSKIREIQEDFE